MKKSKTLKHKKGVQTIPQLRQSFDHMETFTVWLTSVEKDMNKQIQSFQKEWKKVFYHDLDAAAAKAFLVFHTENKKKHKTHTYKSKKSKQKKQSGGQSPLSGAPLGQTEMGPGLPGTYGQFPEYIGSGLSFYDKINQSSFFPTQCGKENGSPTVYEHTGSNAVSALTVKPTTGGSKTRKNRRKQKGGFPTMAEFTQAFSFGPLSPTSPTTPLYDMQTAMKAQPLPPSPIANTGSPPYVSITPQTVSTPAYLITRNLSSELPLPGSNV